LIDNKLKDIKRIIIEELEKENIKVHKIILFGSRARGDFKEDSDWDILVVVDRKLDKEDKVILSSHLRKVLVYKNFICDIILVSKNEFEYKKINKAYIIYYVIKEGIEI
jgi:predicted nucleotidyltransferase